MGHLTLTGKVKLNSLNSSAEGIEWIQLPDSTISISCLQFLGTCEVIMFMYLIGHSLINMYKVQQGKVGLFLDRLDTVLV